MYSQNLWLDRFQLALLDGAVVFGSALTATWLRHALALFGEAPGVPWSAYLFPAALMAVTCVLLMHYQQLYSLNGGWIREAYRITEAVTFGCMVLLALTFFYRGYTYSRGTVLIFYMLSIVSLVGARTLYRAYRSAIRANRAAARRVLIIGFGQSGRYLGRSLLANPGYYELVGFLDDDFSRYNGHFPEFSLLGSTADLERVVRDEAIDEIIVAIPSASPERIMDLIGECLRLRLRWKVVPNLCNLMLDRMHLDYIGDLPLISLRGSRIVGFNWALKRAFDIVFAACVLILLAPLLFSLALLVKLTSSGPILYRQTRIGIDGTPFTFLKFRSMRVETTADVHKSFTADWIYGRTGSSAAPPRDAAKSNGRHAANGSRPDGPAERNGHSAGNGRGLEKGRKKTTHKLTKDNRVTPIGRLLRSTSLDELPQFWNVLRGEMSVVGPRPPVPYEFERYTEWHKRRMEVLPGITGLWQISGRNSLSFDEMVRLDIKYIESWTLRQDVQIALKTIPSMLLHRGH